MLSFHNKQSVKTKYLKRVHAHKIADEIVKGKYWVDGKGCAVGCTIHSDQHNAYETELGIPEWLAHVEDTLFEGMSACKAKAWPEQFLKAIPVGVDLEQIKIPFIVFILKSARESMLAVKYDKKKNPQVKVVIEQCDNVIKQMIQAHKDRNALAAHSDADLAADLAASTAHSAADLAADLAASAAYLAAYSAAHSAADLAADLAASTAHSAVRSAAYEKFAAYLLKLLKGAK
jgi:hypothetical protein